MKRFRGEQIIQVLKEAEAGAHIERCRRHDFGDASVYTRRSKLGGMD